MWRAGQPGISLRVAFRRGEPQNKELLLARILARISGDDLQPPRSVERPLTRVPAMPAIKCNALLPTCLSAWAALSRGASHRRGRLREPGQGAWGPSSVAVNSGPCQEAGC